MNKGDLIDMVAAQLGLSKVAATRSVEAVFRSIARGVAEDDKVAVSGFGTFRKKHRKSRKGRNPTTNEEIVIPPSYTVSFTPSQMLKDAMDPDHHREHASANGRALHIHAAQVESKPAEHHHHQAHHNGEAAPLRLT